MNPGIDGKWIQAGMMPRHFVVPLNIADMPRGLRWGMLVNCLKNSMHDFGKFTCSQNTEIISKKIRISKSETNPKFYDSIAESYILYHYLFQL